MIRNPKKYDCSFERKTIVLSREYMKKLGQYRVAHNYLDSLSTILISFPPYFSIFCYVYLFCLVRLFCPLLDIVISNKKIFNIHCLKN